MPRRLPLYKDGPVRAYGEEDINPDPNKGGMFNNYNRNKLGITINMRMERGRSLVRELIRSSGVLTENFAPGVMERWGLGEKAVRKLQPSISYASASTREGRRWRARQRRSVRFATRPPRGWERRSLRSSRSSA
jgi:hypothetical protein